ncbi:MAG: DUF2497 domain-containing protein [Sphingobium sp.]
MGDMSKEPSMEEILSSIKRIIAEEGEEPQPAPRRGRAEAAPRPTIELGVPAPGEDDLVLAVEPEPEEVLELTDEISEEQQMPAAKQSRPAPRATAPDSDGILSVESEIAARTSLSALSSMLIAPKDGEDNTLDGLVRAMLKPMLKDWLDANLPTMVEDMVAKEIARITAR